MIKATAAEGEAKLTAQLPALQRLDTSAMDLLSSGPETESRGKPEPDHLRRGATYLTFDWEQIKSAIGRRDAALTAGKLEQSSRSGICAAVARASPVHPWYARAARRREVRPPAQPRPGRDAQRPMWVPARAACSKKVSGMVCVTTSASAPQQVSRSPSCMGGAARSPVTTTVPKTWCSSWQPPWRQFEQAAEVQGTRC